MLVTLALGCTTVFISMGIQVAAVIYMLRYLIKIFKDAANQSTGFWFEAYVIGVVLLMLFVGHLLQAGIWALLFMYLVEFSDFQTAFYHSVVNFASRGYGDIVMSEK